VFSLFFFLMSSAVFGAEPDATSSDPDEGGVSQQPPEEDAPFTPAPGGQSIDPDEGGVTEGPDTGGFTPQPGGLSVDPDEGGSSREPPAEELPLTPAPGAQSIDPNEGGSSQPPPDGGFTPTPGAQSIDPDEGGSTEETACSRMERSAPYKTARRAENLADADLRAALASYDSARAMASPRCAQELAKFVSPTTFGVPDPIACAGADHEVVKTKAAYDAAYLKQCHALQDVQKLRYEGNCKSQRVYPCPGD
jgi:hypothetical protein